MTTHISTTGNLTADPKVINPSNGNKPFLSANVAINGSHKENDEWVDDPVWFAEVTLNGPSVPNVAASLSKGQAVDIVGTMINRSYATREGEEREAFRIYADSISPSLRFGTTEFTKTAKGGNSAAKPASAGAKKPAAKKAAAKPEPESEPEGDDDDFV